MFAILLSKGMDPFYQNITSFPTVIFTFVLALCVLYWLVALLGIVDIDALDIDGVDAEFDAGSGPNALAGVVLKFGLNGVPVIIMISFLALIAWLLSYYSVYFLSPIVPDGLLYMLFGVIVVILAFFVAVMMTSWIVKLLRPFFQKVEQQTIKRVLGQIAVVRTLKVNNIFGEANFNDGGAGLIFKVRSIGDQVFVKGDKVVLLEYLEQENVYRVISEQDFNT